MLKKISVMMTTIFCLSSIAFAQSTFSTTPAPGLDEFIGPLAPSAAPAPTSTNATTGAASSTTLPSGSVVTDANGQVCATTLALSEALGLLNCGNSSIPLSTAPSGQ